MNGYDPDMPVVINHIPLQDTRNFTDDYEVICTITSIHPLTTDSLLLYYHLGVDWQSQVLAPTGIPDEYHGFIPAQVPGTVINYYIFARDDYEYSRATSIYTFKVLDYGFLVEPLAADYFGALGNQIWYDFSITNLGIYDDEYTLEISNNVWETTIWDETGSYQVTSTGVLSSDQSFNCKVRVSIESGTYGDFDESDFVVSSLNEPTLVETIPIKTTTLGEAGSFPWADSFPDLNLSSEKWVVNVGAEIAPDLTNPPSAPHVLHLDGGSDTVLSQPVDISSYGSAVLSYFYLRGGEGDKPEEDENLWVDYLNEQGQWINLQMHLGEGLLMSEFEAVGIELPPDAMHGNMQVRFGSVGTNPGYDDWYVDEIRIDLPSGLIVSPASYVETLEPDNTLQDELVIENNGTGTLEYSIALKPDLDFYEVFSRLYFSGQVAPASGKYPAEFYAEPITKGLDGTKSGYATDKNAGGPDQSGNFWIDSDQVGGPTFNWIDVSATGIDIIGDLGDDSHTELIDIAFDFQFYGEKYNQICIGSNGIIGFGTAGMDLFHKTTLPHSDEPNGILAWLWDDLDPTNLNNPNGHVYFESTEDRVVIQFVDYPEYNGNSGDVITAEVILYPDGTIKYQYLEIAPNFDEDYCTVGIENMYGTDGLEVVYLASYLHNELAIVFYQPITWLVLSKRTGIVGPGGSDILDVTFDANGLSDGNYRCNIEITGNDPVLAGNPWLVNADMTVRAAYICGDADNNRAVDILDVIFMIDDKFKDGPEPESLWAADVNGDGGYDILDIVHMIEFKFKDGPPPDCLQN
jgi:hypothetical protein